MDHGGQIMTLIMKYQQPLFCDWDMKFKDK